MGFDLTPPSMPKKSGLMRKFFVKDDLPEAPESPAPEAQQIDLEEIKRKLGLDDEPEPAPKEPVKEPEPPKAEVKIDDWTSDAPDTEEKETDWADAPEEQPIHHELVEEHLAEVDKAHKKIEKKLEEVAERPKLPEWKLQKKEVTPENYFILRNGQPIKSLQELIEILDYIDDSTFEHHVNEYRNDFANWVRDVINEPELADEIQSASDKPGILRSLLTHERKMATKAAKETKTVERIVQKREEHLQKLEGVEGDIASLKKQLEEKTRELTGERKRTAALIKNKLEEEVKRRLGNEKKAMQHAREELTKAKDNYLTKAKEYEELMKHLSHKEKNTAITEQKNHELLMHIKEQRQKLQEEKTHAHELLKDADKIKRKWEEMKKLDVQTKENLDVISKKEIQISRAEESMRQRERKITNDLTRITHEREQLKKEQLEHEDRVAAVKKQEAEARKIIADAETRAGAALEAERGSRDRMRAQLSKLEKLRSHIDTTLAKALKEKKKMSTAIALRKQLEESMSKARDDIVTERKEMQHEAYTSYHEQQAATTPAGQPGVSHNEDIFAVSKKQLPIYAKVEECRSAIESKDLDKAKKLYNELREEFRKAKIPPEEKNILYTNIRELYDDIHLAILG